MANGKIVHYKKIYKITIEGKSDTKYPDEPPIKLTTTESMLQALVLAADSQGAWHHVTMKEIKR